MNNIVDKAVENLHKDCTEIIIRLGDEIHEFCKKNPASNVTGILYSVFIYSLKKNRVKEEHWYSATMNFLSSEYKVKYDGQTEAEQIREKGITPEQFNEIFNRSVKDAAMRFIGMAYNYYEIAYPEKVALPDTRQLLNDNAFVSTLLTQVLSYHLNRVYKETKGTGLTEGILDVFQTLFDAYRKKLGEDND